MASSTWRITASPQMCRHDNIASPSIHHAGRRPAIKAAEFFNTAIEKLADLVSKDFDANIKFIKDVSAAAVLLAALAAFTTGAIIFIPKLLQ